MGRCIRLLRGVELPAQPLHLTLLVPSPPDRLPVSEAVSLLCRTRGLEGLGPGSVQEEELGTVRLALATERHHARLRLTPVVEGRSPNLRAANVENQMTAFDHGTVDEPRGNRRDLAGRH